MIIIAVIHGILEFTKTEFEDGWLVAMSIILAVLGVCNLVVRVIKGRFERIIWLILPLIIFMGSVLLGLVIAISAFWFSFKEQSFTGKS